MLEALSEIRSWLWIALYWIVVYATLLLVGVSIGQAVVVTFYWGVFIIGVPLLIIPLTYRNLVGGRCSLRFQICALVKGMLAGLIFMILASAADMLVWNVLGMSLGWNPTVEIGSTSLLYQIWFLSGTIGGMGARIVEVRGYPEGTEGPLTIAGFE